MPSLRRSLLRRYRLFAPYLSRYGLVLLVLLLLCDGLSVFYFPQMQAALSLSAPPIPTPTPIINSTLPDLAAMTTDPHMVVLAEDTFQRANQLYWGTASDGQTWQADASSAHNFVIFAHSGVIEATPQRIYCNALLGPSATDVEITFDATLSHYGTSFLGAVLRWSNAQNFYMLTLDGQNLALNRVMDSMETPLASVPFPALDGASYTFRFRATGAQLFAMVWPTGQPAPANWQIALSDNALSSGQAGLRVIVQDGAQARITAFKEVQL